MKLLKNFKQWWHGKCENLKKKSAERKKERTIKQIWADLQIMEFNGETYISYFNKPIVRTSNLKDEATKVLAQSRKDYLAWKEKYGY